MRNLRDAISLLWDKAEEQITFKEAQDMSDAHDLAKFLAQDLADVCQNLAGLMAFDQGSEHPSGFLQADEDVPKVLRVMSSCFDTLAALTELGQKASERKLSLMGLYKPGTYEKMVQHAKQQEAKP